MDDIKASELTLDTKGKVYHLAVGPKDIAKTIIFVGDQNRVDLVASFFDDIRFSTQHREFKTVTGTYKGKEFSVVSHGIGCDNIDIVLNELDACVNIDLEKRELKREKTSLDIVRIGTCGALQVDIEPGSHIISKYAIGLDGVANFYDINFTDEETEMANAFKNNVDWPNDLALPYFTKSCERLNAKLSDLGEQGITTTANGFYGPQGRALRIPLKHPDFKDRLRRFEFNGTRSTNFEMETSALLSLSRAMGHSATTICLVLANRYSNKFESDYDTKMGQLIISVLDRLAS
ncbi:MAG TPA: phosphorylase [Crocinitomix sp.]|nr:phosphorylase [Crocinitomix sp.]